MQANGKLLHTLADKRCGDFKVCNVDGVDSAGMSKVNYDLGDLLLFLVSLVTVQQHELQLRGSLRRCM